MVESAKWVGEDGGSIESVIDGHLLIVPDDMGNRHRRLVAEWEAAGNSIEPYITP